MFAMARICRLVALLSLRFDVAVVRICSLLALLLILCFLMFAMARICRLVALLSLRFDVAVVRICSLLALLLILCFLMFAMARIYLLSLWEITLAATHFSENMQSVQSAGIQFSDVSRPMTERTGSGSCGLHSQSNPKEVRFSLRSGELSASKNCCDSVVFCAPATQAPIYKVLSLYGSGSSPIHCASATCCISVFCVQPSIPSPSATTACMAAIPPENSFTWAVSVPSALKVRAKCLPAVEVPKFGT
eukprot:TRINITY_DN65814_c0_g1_i1.p1 TRINITY_DN65814_c0_g1~~TRINITY_DN65814_c0_g1_i1.p1  ORF type:complete len:248 (-),score=26.31 TRINITY_DN65814_c0_g1_i1:26-769(-)